jgi:hypothetical protein
MELELSKRKCKYCDFQFGTPRGARLHESRHCRVRNIGYLAAVNENVGSDEEAEIRSSDEESSSGDSIDSDHVEGDGGDEGGLMGDEGVEGSEVGDGEEAGGQAGQPMLVSGNDRRVDTLTYLPGNPSQVRGGGWGRRRQLPHA